MGQVLQAQSQPWSRAGLRHLALAAALALCCLGLLAVGSAAAQQSPLASHSYVYGQMVQFRLTLPPTMAADTATLYVTVDSTTDAEAVAVDNGNAVLVRDLVSSALPPFADIVYWWEYADAAGRLVQTPEQSFRYIDNRYPWQSVEKSDVRVHWIDGDRAQMVQVVNVARAALASLREALDAPAGEPVDVYIYPSETDLASALQLAGRTWASSMAYPELGVVLVAIPPTDESVFTVQRDIPHELTHKVLYDLLGKYGYASLPTWLNEGLATKAEARPDPSYATLVEQAHQGGTLISLADLCYPFPEATDQARLAYAESGSVVDYLLQTHGWSTMRALLHAYADGLGCDAGVKSVLGVDLAQVEHAWRVSLEEKDLPADTGATLTGAVVFLRDAGPWLVLFGALLVPAVLTVVTLRRS